MYWESHDEVHKAIAREKQLKAGGAKRSCGSSGQFNPGWKDLAADWYENARSLDLPSLALGTALGMTECERGKR